MTVLINRKIVGRRKGRAIASPPWTARGLVSALVQYFVFLGKEYC